MTRLVTGPQFSCEVYDAATQAPIAGAVVTVAPLVYTDSTFLTNTTSLVSNALGIITGYGTPGTYTFTTTATGAAAIEAVQLLTSPSISGTASYPSFSGHAGDVLTVNPTETGVEWETEIPGGEEGELDGGDALDVGSVGDIDGGDA